MHKSDRQTNRPWNGKIATKERDCKWCRCCLKTAVKRWIYTTFFYKQIDESNQIVNHECTVCYVRLIAVSDVSSECECEVRRRRDQTDQYVTPVSQWSVISVDDQRSSSTATNTHEYSQRGAHGGIRTCINTVHEGNLRKTMDTSHKNLNLCNQMPSLQKLSMHFKCANITFVAGVQQQTLLRSLQHSNRPSSWI